MNPLNITIDGVTRSLREWASMPGAAAKSTIYGRIMRGVAPKIAVFGRPDWDRARLITINGHTLPLAVWSRKIGARDRKWIAELLKRGHEPIDAVFYYRGSAPRPESKIAHIKQVPFRPTWGGVLSISWKAA